MSMLAAVGAVLLLLLLLVVVIAMSRAKRHAERVFREGQWAAQWCVVCLRAISSADQAVGIRARAIPNVLAGPPEELREAAENSPTRVLIGHRRGELAHPGPHRTPALRRGGIRPPR